MRVAGVCLAPDVAPSFRIRSYVGMLNRGGVVWTIGVKVSFAKSKISYSGNKDDEGCS
jgi:hypothetical protein